MNRRVAIVGTGQTACKSARADVNFPAMTREAVDMALEDSNLSIKDIDAVIFASSPLMWHGNNFVECWLADACGAVGKPFFRVGGTGTCSGCGTQAGAYLVASGMFEKVLVVAAEQLSAAGQMVQRAGRHAINVFWDHPFFSGSMGLFATHGNAYLDTYGYTPEQMSYVSVKDHKNALKNPNAQVRRELTVKEIRESQMISYPLTYLDCPPAGDSSSAVVLAAEELVPKITPKPAWLKGWAAASSAMRLPSADKEYHAPLPGLVEASQKAYKIAGITNPRKEIDAFELYSPFPMMEPIMMESLGIFEPGEGLGRIVEGATEMDGPHPVNASGGVLSNNPIGPTSMLRIIEGALQVTGQAGDHQIPGTNTVLATGFGGYNHFHVVTIITNS